MPSFKEPWQLVESWFIWYLAKTWDKLFHCWIPSSFGYVLLIKSISQMITYTLVFPSVVLELVRLKFDCSSLDHGHAGLYIFLNNCLLKNILSWFHASGCRADASEAAIILLPSNITVFTLDFSGSGISGGDHVTLGWNEVSTHFMWFPIILEITVLLFSHYPCYFTTCFQLIDPQHLISNPILGKCLFQISNPILGIQKPC